MRTNRKISRWVLAVLVGSAVLCAAVFAVSYWLRPVQWSGDPELTALAAEREGLRGADDEALDRLREKVRSRTTNAWSAESIAAFADGLAPGWRCQWTGAGRAVVTRVDPRLGDWPEILAFARDWAGRPGVALHRVELVAAGPGSRRHFTRVSLGLRFTQAAASTAGAGRSAPSRSPPRAGPASGAATTRQAGPAAPPPPGLRLPRRFAAVRPSGCPGRVRSTQIKESIP